MNTPTAPATNIRSVASAVTVVTLLVSLLVLVSPAIEADAEQGGALTPVPVDVATQLEELFAPALDQTTRIIDTGASYAAGFDGAGQTVAIIDTGVDSNHSFVRGRVVHEACFTDRGCPNGADRQVGSGSAAPCIWGTGCGHGTHVAGIIGGSNSRMRGVSPGANIIAIQVFSRVDDPFECEGVVPCARARTSDVLEALEYVYSLRSQYQISAINLSLSSDDARTGCDRSVMKPPIDRLRNVGIATVVSSGNGGYKNGLGLPACISSTISVGATSDASDRVWELSNSSGELDFLAPGVSVNSSVPGGSFATATGTSAAAPHVAGAWALSAQRLRTRDVNTIAAHLRTSGIAVRDANGVSTPRLDLGLPFLDVVPGDFFYGAVTYLLDRNITTGVSATQFSPNAGVTRGQMATFLYRMSGSPRGNPNPGFADVPRGVYFSEPIAWMKARGLTSTPRGGNFAPQRTVTRAEMAAFLHRLAGSPQPASNRPFVDVPQGVFYSTAVQWLREAGITLGIGNNRFGPNNAVTRGQMAAFLHRLHLATGIG